jgi:PIN like domain
VNFFLDNCLSPRYAGSLHILSQRDGHRVIHLSEMFERDVTDPTWIRALAESKDDWTIVSGDSRILRTPHLKAVWLASGLTAFFLDQGWMKVSYWDQVAALVRWWPKIIDQASLVERGAGFEVPFRSAGRFKLIR